MTIRDTSNIDKDGSLDFCAYIRDLPDEQLSKVISIPVLAQDLLEHAAFCRECGARIEAIERLHVVQSSIDGSEAIAVGATDLVQESIVPKSREYWSLRQDLLNLEAYFAERREPRPWEFNRIGTLGRSIELHASSFQAAKAMGAVLGSATVEYEHDLSRVLDELRLASFRALKLIVSTGDETKAFLLLLPRSQARVLPEEASVVLDAQLVDAAGLPLSSRCMSLQIGRGMRSNAVRVSVIGELQRFVGGVRLTLRKLYLAEKEFEND